MPDLSADLVALHDRIRLVEHGVHAKLDLALRAIHHILERHTAMDHADRLSLVNKLDGELDALLVSASTFVTDHEADQDANADVDAKLAAWPDKVAKIGALFAAPAAAKAVQPVSTTVTVSGSTEAPTDTVPVDDTSKAPIGSAVSGPGMASNATVTAVGNGTITVSPSTTDDHSGGETLTVVPPAAQS